jgi:hypothetical protein
VHDLHLHALLAEPLRLAAIRHEDVDPLALHATVLDRIGTAHARMRDPHRRAQRDHPRIGGGNPDAGVRAGRRLASLAIRRRGEGSRTRRFSRFRGDIDGNRQEQERERNNRGLLHGGVASATRTPRLADQS